ncbi:hypothetical protein HBB16_19910 [Pseudonocardia sp. MCCB 268]|nr:hypothetical protein [Pseudonocardia cytotoxica]
MLTRCSGSAVTWRTVLSERPGTPTGLHRGRGHPRATVPAVLRTSAACRPSAAEVGSAACPPRSPPGSTREGDRRVGCGETRGSACAGAQRRASTGSAPARKRRMMPPPGVRRDRRVAGEMHDPALEGRDELIDGVAPVRRTLAPRPGAFVLIDRDRRYRRRRDARLVSSPGRVRADRPESFRVSCTLAAAGAGPC